MTIRECTIHDVSELAVMNKQLIEDEQSNNPMSMDELEKRMASFLNGYYKAYFFEEDDQVIGYALVNHSSEPLYLRQFFIGRDFRRRHLGEQAFQLLISYLDTDMIDIDVLPWNKAGYSFWKKCGFDESCISMRYVGK